MVGSPFLEKLDLTQSIELILGIIVVLMMLFRRGGLLPAYRHQAALSFEQQHAEVRRGSAVGIKGLGAILTPAARCWRCAVSPWLRRTGGPECD